MGLNREFPCAGILSVVMTLLKIDDKSAEVLWKIYKNLKKNEDIADFLKNSRIEMICRDRAPYGWAAFILPGKYLY